MHELDKTGLEPCPFCGGEASLRNGGPGCFFVQCDMCNATSDDGSQDRAIARWNSRATATSAGVTEEQTARVTDAMVEAAAEVFWADFHGRLGGPWNEVAAGLIIAVQTRATARAALEAALEASRVAPVSQKAETWTCAARKQGTAGGNDPADCDWPVCGCDPHAVEVIAALQETGLFAPVSQKEAGSVPSALDRIMADDRLRRARSKLSFDEIKKIIDHTKAAIREGGSNA